MNLVIEKDNSLLTEALFWKSKSLYEIGLYSDSKVELELFFRKASIKTSYYEDARFLYCKVFYKLKKYEDALLLFNQFIRNRSFSYYSDPALFWIGETYLQLSKLKLAKESFNQYLKLQPNSFITKKRVDVIENMLVLLERSTDEELSSLDRANWLSEYVLKEQQETSENDNMYISNFLNKFSNKDEFFKWLENYYLIDENTKLEEKSTKRGYN
jgi:tetratricopeptide (TPR) repeat protein